MSVQKIEITQKTILNTIGFLVGAYILFLIRDILIGIFISVMLMSAFNPIVNLLEKRKFPRILAIWLIYIVLILLFIAMFMSVIPPVIDQTTTFIETFPVDSINEYILNNNIELGDISFLTNQIDSLPKAINIISSTFSAVITIITLLVMTFYLLLSRDVLHKKIAWIFGSKQQDRKAKAFIDKVETQIGRWVRGEMALMLIIGVSTYIGLRLLGIPYAIPLAIIAGLLEILPNIGPIISAIPAIIIAFFAFSSWYMAVAVTALYTIIQQIENNLIVPQIMKSAVGVDPIITIILLLVGFRLGGVAGAALAIPLFLVSKIVITEFNKAKKKVLDLVLDNKNQKEELILNPYL
jgi:predicted PurR-regulated permease PerM